MKPHDEIWKHFLPLDANGEVLVDHKLFKTAKKAQCRFCDIQPPTLQCQTLLFCLHFDAFLGRLQFGTHFTTFFVVVAAQIPLSHPLAVFWLPFLLLKQAQSVCSVQQTSNQPIFPSPPPSTPFFPFKGIWYGCKLMGAPAWHLPS